MCLAVSCRPNYAVQSTAAPDDGTGFKAKAVFDEMKKSLAEVRHVLADCT